MGSKLAAIMKKVNSDAKEEVFRVGLPSYDYEKIPFTSPRMNNITFGGLPTGRLSEFYGEEGGGKTTTALDQVGNYQILHPDKEILYVDAEHTLDLDWAKKLGVDVDRINLYTPMTESAEYVFQVIKDAVSSGELGMWVLDSVACLTAEKDLGKQMDDDERVGGVSKPLTRFCREIIGLCHKYNCSGIFINQLRDKINSRIPGQTSTPGGRGLKHFCTTRIEFRKGEFLDENGKTISRSSGSPDDQRIMVNMVKSKFCSPGRHIGYYTINFDDGIDYISDLIDLAIEHDIIVKSGAWFEIVNTDTGELLSDSKIQGQSKVADYLEQHEDVLAVVEQLVNRQIGVLE